MKDNSFLITSRFETIKKTFHAALDCDPDQLSAFLNKRCAGNEVLRAEVDELLAAHRHGGSFIETSIANLATSIIRNGQRELLAGRTIGHYKILERIGSGGMGEVYLATDNIAARKAALKFLAARFTGDAERLKRFQQEARVVAGLNHPNVLTVYEIGAHNATHYIASELIEGETLRERLARGHMQLNEAIEIAIQVTGALAAAHEAGIVHRDVKPENIMLRPDGYVKVLDFGIAKLAEQELPVTIREEEALLLVETHLGSVLGTVRYMSPEQARGGYVDKRTDIWSLGVVLYEMLTGRAPFKGDTPKEVMTSILAAEPPPFANDLAKAPGALQPIVSKALQKDPAQRYENAHELLDALKTLRRKVEVTAELERSKPMPLWLRWIRSPTALVLTFLAGALAVSFLLYWLRNPATSAPPQKSVAVLPFQNLSREQENAFFADGVQDEILSDLAKVADLKVISRTSANLYKSGNARNAREIGQQLGVAHLVVGSVQRIGDQLRVRAQLIDARNDTHLWAQTYDREVANIFAIQSEIAQSIVAQLHAKISPQEKVAITQPPTVDLVANALYAQARVLELNNDLQQGARLLEEAVARDPQFVRAYCLLSELHLQLFNSGYDRTAARRELAEAAIHNALRLQPDAGEVHLALAKYAYWSSLDYDRARAELEVARRTLPNSAEVAFIEGLLDRRQGRWVEAVRNFERAVELDPRNQQFLGNTGGVYEALRRYAEATRFFEHARAISVRGQFFRSLIATLPFYEKADLRPLHNELTAVLEQRESPEDPDVFYRLAFRCAMAERDSATVNRVLALIPPAGLPEDNSIYPREWFVAVAARAFNDTSAARSAFGAARAVAEKLVREQSDYGPAWSLLGRIDAGLGRKAEAIREGRRACELLPPSKDAVIGAPLVTNLAAIYAWTDEKDLALEQLAVSAQLPNGVHYGELKLDPQWDSLRGDPRFEKIVTSLAPK